MMGVYRYRCRFDLSGWTKGFIRGCEDGFECNLWLHERWVSSLSTHPLSGAMSPYLIPLRAFKLCVAAKREAAQCGPEITPSITRTPYVCGFARVKAPRQTLIFEQNHTMEFVSTSDDMADTVAV
jgi:hypothetical protein